jgi:hypothetical protein
LDFKPTETDSEVLLQGAASASLCLIAGSIAPSDNKVMETTQLLQTISGTSLKRAKL